MRIEELYALEENTQQNLNTVVMAYSIWAANEQSLRLYMY